MDLDLRFHREERWKRVAVDWVDRLSWTTTTVLSISLITFFSLIDLGVSSVARYSFSLVLFYLVPISFCAWAAGVKTAVMLSSLTALLIAAAHAVSYNRLHPFSYFLANVLLEFLVLVAASYVMAELRHALECERLRARLDPVSGVANLFAFREIGLHELERSRRSRKPLTVAYIDVDDFKKVNDCFGHVAGDKLLKVIGQRAKDSLRAADVVARVGGDEFAVLLPETDREQARVVLDRMVASVETATNNLLGTKVTLSVGVKTFLDPPDDIERLLNCADSLMYGVKRSTKAAVAYA